MYLDLMVEFLLNLAGPDGVVVVRDVTAEMVSVRRYLSQITSPLDGQDEVPAEQHRAEIRERQAKPATRSGRELRALIQPGGEQVHGGDQPRVAECAGANPIERPSQVIAPDERAHVPLPREMLRSATDDACKTVAQPIEYLLRILFGPGNQNRPLRHADERRPVAMRLAMHEIAGAAKHIGCDADRRKRFHPPPSSRERHLRRVR